MHSNRLEYEIKMVVRDGRRNLYVDVSSLERRELEKPTPCAGRQHFWNTKLLMFPYAALTMQIPSRNIFGQV